MVMGLEWPCRVIRACGYRMLKLQRKVTRSRGKCSEVKVHRKKCSEVEIFEEKCL